MSSSGDYSSYDTEFSGDETGQIFDAPNAAPAPADASQRTVDTQSGFIVNVKNIDGRVTLLVKRRVGTPPASSVVLTPDESLKLSKILALSSGDELTGMANYYAAQGAGNRRSKRSLIKSLPSAPKLGGILSLVLLLTAAALGYYAHPLLDAWLRNSHEHSFLDTFTFNFARKFKSCP